MAEPKKGTTYINGVSLKEGKFSIRFSGKVKDFVKQLKEHETDDGYFNFEIVKRKEVGQFGDTHYMKLNTYEKKK